MTHAQALSTFYSMLTPLPPFISLNFSPIFWGGGVVALMGSILNPSETRIVTAKAFDLNLMVELVEKYKPATVNLPPPFLVPFLNSPLSKTCDFSSVKMVSCFGTIVTADLREQFKKSFPGKFLSTLYAMTETSCTKTFFGDSFDGLKVGKIATNIWLKIVDEDGKNLGYGEHGEILIKPEFGFVGYLDAQATKDAVDSEGFYKTGDIGYFEKDASLHVLNRSKDIFKYKMYQASFKHTFQDFNEN